MTLANISLELLQPTLELQDAFLRMNAEYHSVERDRFDAIADVYRSDIDAVTFPAYLQQLRDATQPELVAPGRVPSHTFWLVRNATDIVAVSRFRHWLTLALEQEGGHIGYNVRPSARRQGYGTAVLARTLAYAQQFGLSQALITCDIENIGSAKIIQANGGVWQDDIVSPATGRTISRYWIKLR